MTWLQDNWLKLVAMAFLLGALGPVPYVAYFQIMNWVVVGAASVTAWQAYKQNQSWITWIFIAVAVLFNPMAPIFLRADIWQLADIVVALLFIASFYFVKK